MVQSFKFLAQKTGGKAGKRKKEYPRVWGERCWKRWGGCAGPVSPSAAKPPAGVHCPRAQGEGAPRCSFGGDPDRNYLVKPPKKAEFGVLATMLLCSGAGDQVREGHDRAGWMDGWTDRDGQSLQKISAGKGRWQGVKRHGGVVVGF